MRLPRPFIQLPYRFDADQLALEVAALPPSAWRAHPSGLPGNSAVPLVSRNGESNDDFYGEMKATRELDGSPYTQTVLATFGEVLGRSRFMRLAPGSEVSTHVDFNYHWRRRVRIHIPVVTEPEVVFTCGDESRHLPPGECWIFDSWLRHRVTHGGRDNRVHLVVDLAGSSRFWQMVAGQRPPAERHAPLRFERCNIPTVMSPGELELLIGELLNDLSSNRDNDTNQLQRYNTLLNAFLLDWQEVWLEHGAQKSGWAAYRALIRQLRQALSPNPRTLTTASNDIGVNPIIVQRILTPALTADQG